MNRFFCLLLFLPFLAQAHYFTVLEAHYASLNGVMLANNQMLPDSGIIEIVDGGRLVLSHAQGKLLSLSLPGQYSIADLLASQQNIPASLEKTAFYTLEALVNAKSARIFTYTKKTGSVYADIQAPPYFIPLTKRDKVYSFRGFPQQFALVLDSSQINKMGAFNISESAYCFAIHDFLEDTIELFQSKLLSMELDFSHAKYDSLSGNALKITIGVVGNSNSSHTLAVKFYQPSQKKELYETIQWLYAQPTAFHSLMLAFYCEENGLDAMTLWGYEEAVRRSKNNARYVQAYKSYLAALLPPKE